MEERVVKLIKQKVVFHMERIISIKMFVQKRENTATIATKKVILNHVTEQNLGVSVLRNS